MVPGTTVLRARELFSKKMVETKPEPKAELPNVDQQHHKSIFLAVTKDSTVRRNVIKLLH